MIRLLLFAVMLAGRAEAVPWECATSYADVYYLVRAGACSTCYERMTASAYEEAVKHPAMRGATVWGARQYDVRAVDNPCPRCGEEGKAVGVERFNPGPRYVEPTKKRIGFWLQDPGWLVIRYVCRHRHTWTEKVKP